MALRIANLLLLRPRWRDSNSAVTDDDGSPRKCSHECRLVNNSPHPNWQLGESPYGRTTALQRSVVLSPTRCVGHRFHPRPDGEEEEADVDVNEASAAR
ncbi:hypothetical protein EYF80_015780 [Liparis tanakae]|uniref:Uncharacterized protein n=1 Tax=Liparis tanakae TaxID=230148 RepID=A0A4Z2I7C9_9TELE|nr:hypothetical protein EYF80_015780 [Liparis tanakae]